MSENQLWEQIKFAQKEKGQALLMLIEKFSPLIYKYAGLLRYEDAKNDLCCDFISLILGFNTDVSVSYDDPSVLSYIKKSIHRSYIARSTEYVGDVGHPEPLKLDSCVGEIGQLRR